MFKFIRCRYKLHPKIDRYEEGWFLHIDTQEAFDRFIDKRSNTLVKKYFNLKKTDKQGNRKEAVEHLTDWDEITISNILTLDDTRRTIMDDCRHLDRLLSGYQMLFLTEGHVLVNHNNGCRTMDETFEILETRIRKELVFPLDEKMPYTITQWPNGTHFYVRIGDYDLTDKFFTHESAEKAAQDWIKKNKDNK